MSIKHLLLLLSIAFFIYIIQMQLILSSDVASLLYDTELFLAGGTYVKDFFETNPPMIFILYTPIVMLHKLTALNIKSLANLYIIFIGVISLSYCYFFLNIIFSKDDSYFKNAFFFMLIFTFFIVPLNDFGQREHLLWMLGMPYLLAAVIRAKNLSISSSAASVIGLMAGLVFSLKPFFLIPLLLIELYLMVIKKNIWSWIRIEFLILSCVMIAYVAYVYFCHPLYFNVLMPLISKYYFVGTKESLTLMISKPKVIFCLGVIAYYLFLFPKNHFPELSGLLFLALIGFVLAFIIPGSAWSYHVFPAYASAILLSVIYIYALWEKEIKTNVIKKKEMLFIVLAGFAMPMFIYVKETIVLVNLLNFKDRNRLYETIKTMPLKSIYCVSATTTGLCFPLITEHHREFAGRFPLLWWVRGLRMIEDKYADHLPVDVIQDKNYFTDAIAYDLNHYKPELIIIFNAEEKVFLPKGYDYPTYLSKRESFKMAWSHYQFVEKMGIFTLYRRSF